MSINRTTGTFLIVLLLSIILPAAVSAQDKETKSCSSSCCEGKDKTMHQSKGDHSQIDHSMMNETMTSQTDSEEQSDTVASAKEVDSKLQAWNAVCPVKGEEIDPEGKKVEYNGMIYGFCCNSCVSKFINDTKKYSQNLSVDGKSFIEKN